MRSRRDEPVTIRQFYDRQLLLIGLGLFAFTVEVMRRLAELNGHNEVIKDNQSKSVTRREFDDKARSDADALGLALEKVNSDISPLKDFRSRVYGMAVILVVLSAIAGALLMRALD